jgi:hypothetical protein
MTIEKSMFPYRAIENDRITGLRRQDNMMDRINRKGFWGEKEWVTFASYP